MIRSFKHKGLERFFRRTDSRGIPAQYESRIGRILDVLDAAVKPEEMNLPGYRFHRLKGDRADTYSVTVTGNLRVTFAFEGEDAIRVDLEDYH
jgi:proteic killer suppression protein